MKTATSIVKNIFQAQLEKDSQFDLQKLTDVFWEKITRAFLNYETDPKPLYATIYSLELQDPEKVISKLSGHHSSFLKELAESYVLGIVSEASDSLIKKHNESFLEQLQFYKTLQQVVKKVERKRIKEELPHSYERLTFELSETNITNAAKKKGREDLKAKMKNWDGEMEEVPVVSMVNNLEKTTKESKVVSLSWIKYAVAACVILTVGIFYFKNTDSAIVPVENQIVTTDDKNENPIKTVIVKPEIVLAEISKEFKNTTILEPSRLGFTETEKLKVTIDFVDATARITSLEKNLTKVVGDKNMKLQIELSALKQQQGKYLFNGKTLTVYETNKQKSFSILRTEDSNYFLEKEGHFYYLRISKVVLSYEKVTDSEILKTLERIQFDNE